MNEYTPAEDTRHKVGGKADLYGRMLVEEGWKPGKNLKYLEAEGAEHNERAWAARVGSILAFLFPKK